MTYFAAALLAISCDGGGDHGTTVEFWGFGREGEVVRELVPGFERANPGVRVKVQQIPWTAAHEKLLTAFVGEALPDVAQLGNTWVPEFAALDALAPLDDRVAASAVVEAGHHFPGIWDTNVVDGALYGVPWYVDTRLLFYRTDLLAAAGFAELPRDWSGWRAAMVRLRALAPAGHFAILLPVDEWAQPVILGMANDATFLTERDSRAAFRAREFRQAFEFYIAMFHDGLAPALGNPQVANVYQQFAEGVFALYPTGPWNLGEFRRRLPPEAQGRWATAPMPAPDGAAWPGASLAGGSSLVVFSSSDRQDAAWRFVEWLSAPERQVEFYRLTGDLPAHRDAWRDPRLAGDAEARSFWLQLQNVRPTPKVPEWEQIATKIYEHAELAARRRMTVDAALAALDREVDRILEKRRWLLARRGPA